MIEKQDIPKFESEAEEAEWWDRHREDTARWLEQAVAAGEATTLSAVLQRARARLAGSGAVHTDKRVFISHSSRDEQFAELVVAKLRKHDKEPWIDSDHIGVGDDIFEKLGDALKTSDLFVFIVSSAALQSGWVDLEVKFAATRQIKEKRVLVMPFIIDETEVDALPWFLRSLNVRQVSADAAGAADVAAAVQRALDRRFSLAAVSAAMRAQFERDSRIDRLIGGVKFLDREAAAAAAIEIVKATDASGRNELFEALLNYQDHPDDPDDDFLMRVLSVIESCAKLAPWLIDHQTLTRMSVNRVFSVRSSAAFICMNFARFAPDRAPVDILTKLSVYDEDWYVQAPANAALKAMARALPAVLQIFFMRLHNASAEERAHSAYALLDIAEKEPDMLDAEELERELFRLRRIGDKDAVHYLEKALPKVQQVSHVSGHKYGI